MRLSSFLLGGVVGASTVWVLKNRNHPLVNLMKLMKQDSMSKKNAQSGKQSSIQQSQQHSYSEQTREENASLIRSIIEQDPKLQKEFNSISNQAVSAEYQNATTEQAQQH